ncbi:helicase family member protein [Theileria equi strain WA]|uniref:Helicase family member protein n=1 Tax=Theileria equi strain WA TaxID=1537102 RepID=L1LA53_THEEQ|nr:helicase family member protein [Theileria equi strain WA]EKX72317.1 helicase family member protein [Theileria equi strain WA]|eukprot:XP_004831769.1 helicase family member protein [Theileria equi strain WA]
MDVSNLGYVDIVCGLRNLISSGSDFQDVRYRQLMHALNNYRTRRGENLQEWVELDGNGQNPFNRQQYECLLTQIDIYVNYLAKGLKVPPDLLSRSSNIQTSEDGHIGADSGIYASDGIKNGSNYAIRQEPCRNYNSVFSDSTYDASYNMEAVLIDVNGTFNYKPEEFGPGMPNRVAVKSEGMSQKDDRVEKDSTGISEILTIADTLHRSSDFWGPGCFWLDYKDNLDQNKLTFILTAVTNLKSMLEYVMHVNTKESVKNLENLARESGLYDYIFSRDSDENLCKVEVNEESSQKVDTTQGETYGSQGNKESYSSFNQVPVQNVSQKDPSYDISSPPLQTVHQNQGSDASPEDEIPFSHLQNAYISLVRLENMINLLVLQRSLKSMISLTRVLDYSPNFKHPERSFRKDLPDYIRHFTTLHKENRKVSRKNAISAVRAIEVAIKRIEMQESAKQKQRLEALRAHNEEDYLRLLKESKESKFLQIIKQTEVYMDYMSHLLVRARQVSDYARVCATQNETARPSVEGSDSTLQTDTSTPQDTSVQSIMDAKTRYYTVANCVKEDIKQDIPSLNGKLRKYQMDGLNWLVSLYNNKLNGIFADEMGLGKTIQTIALLAYLKDHKGISGVHMVLAPLSTLHGNWKNELENWFPSCKICIYEGTKEYRKSMRNRWYENGSCRPNFDVLLTTDSFILRDKTYLRKICWEYLIVDEAHRLKNPNSKLVKVLNQGFVVNRRLALTGTPLQNDLHELWALLNFLMPELFASSKNFDEWFNVPLGSIVRTKDTDTQQAALSEEEQLLIIDRIHKILKPFLLRREKYEVADEVPLNFEYVVCCPMSGIQTRLYEFLSSRETTHNKMIQLRKVINHPYLYCPGNFPCNDNIIMSCGKFAMLDIILARLFQVGHRVLIFSQMTSLLDILEVYLRYRNYQYLRLDGSLNSDQRVDRLKKFNEENSPYFVFILSTKAGALGLNLQTADTVIIYDSDWNPQVDIQAKSRVHRIGQKSQVITIRFVTPNTIEENILKSTSVKLSQDALAIKSGEYHGVQVEDGSKQEEVIKILRRNNECDGSYGVRTIERIDEILARNDEDKKSFYFTAFKTFMMNPFGVIQEKVIPPFLYQSIANSKKIFLTDSDRILLSVEEDTWNSILLDYDIYAVEPTDECMNKFANLLESCNSRDYSEAFLYSMNVLNNTMKRIKYGNLYKRENAQYLERGKRLKIGNVHDINMSINEDEKRKRSVDESSDDILTSGVASFPSDECDASLMKSDYAPSTSEPEQCDEYVGESNEGWSRESEEEEDEVVRSKSSSIESIENDSVGNSDAPQGSHSSGLANDEEEDDDEVPEKCSLSLQRVPSSSQTLMHTHSFDEGISDHSSGINKQICSITSLDLSYPQERIRNLNYFMRYLNDRPMDKIKSDKLNALHIVLKDVLTSTMNDARFIDFVNLPDKSIYVDYYDRVSNPISLSCILNSLGSIESLYTFKKQMELVLSNCMTYNGAESAIFRRSIELYAHINAHVHEKLAMEYIRVYNPNRAKEFEQVVCDKEFPSNWKINPLFK